MKTIAVAALGLSLLAGSTVFAQDAATTQTEAKTKTKHKKNKKGENSSTTTTTKTSEK